MLNLFEHSVFLIPVRPCLVFFLSIVLPAVKDLSSMQSNYIHNPQVDVGLEFHWMKNHHLVVIRQICGE